MRDYLKKEADLEGTSEFVDEVWRHMFLHHLAVNLSVVTEILWVIAASLNKYGGG